MKKRAIVAVACSTIAGNAVATPLGITAPANTPLVQQANGHGRGGGGWGGGGGGWSRGSGVGIVVDMPLRGTDYGNIPRPTYDHCREARNICFESWGIDGRRYGRCMWRLGC